MIKSYTSNQVKKSKNTCKIVIQTFSTLISQFTLNFEQFDKLLSAKLIYLTTITKNELKDTIRANEKLKFVWMLSF